jgi:2-polyprenyl-3-methyl-5-hydroxy-6-metoxy-1,4-benzoquinol methylase
MQRAKPIIVECMKRLNPKSVLDLGCGKCKFSKLFIDKGVNVTGVDKENTIKSKDNLTFIKKDVRDFEFEKNMI